MKYKGINGEGYEWSINATNHLDAIAEAYEDMTRGFSEMSDNDFDQLFRGKRLNCYIDCYADDATEDDEPLASAYIEWHFDCDDGEYSLREVRVSLFNDTEIVVKSDEIFRKAIEQYMATN